MKIIVDMDKLTTNLRGAAPKMNELVLPEGAMYLFHTYHQPSVSGETVYLNSLDFDRFDRSDINALRHYLDGIEERRQALHKIAKTFSDQAPAYVGNRSFF
jgi:hypothetical protein